MGCVLREQFEVEACTVLDWQAVVIQFPYLVDVSSVDIAKSYSQFLHHHNPLYKSGRKQLCNKLILRYLFVSIVVEFVHDVVHFFIVTWVSQQFLYLAKLNVSSLVLVEKFKCLFKGLSLEQFLSVGGGNDELREIDLPGAIYVDGVDNGSNVILLNAAVDCFVGLDKLGNFNNSTAILVDALEFLSQLHSFLLADGISG